MSTWVHGCMGWVGLQRGYTVHSELICCHAEGRVGKKVGWMGAWGLNVFDAGQEDEGSTFCLPSIVVGSGWSATRIGREQDIRTSSVVDGVAITSSMKSPAFTAQTLQERLS
eukprot:1185913-Prorocentrum_minimum.AAC.3